MAMPSFLIYLNAFLNRRCDMEHVETQDEKFTNQLLFLIFYKKYHVIL